MNPVSVPESQKAAKPSMEDYRQLVDTVPEVVFRISASGRIEILNQAWRHHTGHLLEESIGEPLQLFMLPKDFGRLECLRGIGRIREKFCFLDSEGNGVWFMFSATLLDGGYSGTLTKLDSHEISEKGRGSNEELFRQIIENVPEILFQLDHELRLQFVNPAWTAISGFNEIETLGRPLNDFIADLHPISLGYDLLPNRVYSEEFMLRCKDGNLRSMTMLGRTIVNPADGKTLIIGTLLDVTECREMAQNLRRSEERYAILASSTTDGIWDWDLATNQVFFSPRWKAMIGYEDQEIDNVFDSWYQRVHPQDIQAAMDAVNACLDGHAPHYENIHRLRHKDHSWRWILDRGIVLRDENGLPYRMVGTHADVTLLKKTEDRLQQREHELEAIFSISPDGIVTINQQGYVQSVNPAFLEMTGFDANSLLGLSEYDFERCLVEISQSSSSAPRLGHSDKRVYRVDLKQSRVHPYSRKYQKLPDKLNSIPSPKVRVLARTERHIHAQEIAKVLYFRDISVESEVDQMKSQFLSTAAHELRTPMASVFGFSELLLDRDFDTDTRQEIISTIHQQSGALVDMLNQLLDLARIESRMGMDFCFVQQPLWPIVQRAISELFVPGDPRQVLALQPRKDYQVLVDADKLRQVISNVLVNAYKYSPGGGEISVKVRSRVKKANEAEVGIVIKDCGLGMTRSQLKHVFERFWRADNSGGIPGTGLGMSLVKEIMDIHQGTIEIQSQPNVGTCVTLWLKRIEAPKPN